MKHELVWAQAHALVASLAASAGFLGWHWASHDDRERSWLKHATTVAAVLAGVAIAQLCATLVRLAASR